MRLLTLSPAHNTRPATMAVAALVMLWGCAPTRQALAAEFPAVPLADSMRVQIVSEGMAMHGVPTQILRFRASDSVEALTGFYATQWRRMAEAYVEPWTVLSHRDDDHLITVQLQPGAMNQSLGYIAVSELFPVVEGKRRLQQPDLPTLPGTSVLQHLQSNNLGRASETVMLLSERSVHENLEFYRSHFREQGYEPLGGGALAKGASDGAMILNRGSERLDLAVTRYGGKTLVTVVRVRQ